MTFEEDESLLCQFLDWLTAEGIVLVNKRDLQKDQEAPLLRVRRFLESL